MILEYEDHYQISLHNILILEDDRNLLDLYRRIFRDSYNVLTATTLEEARSIAKTYEIACVLIDLKINGNSTKGLRITEFVKAPWCIIVSGFIDTEAVKEANAVGITSIIQKPPDFDSLKKLVDRTVHRVVVEKKIEKEIRQWGEEIKENTEKLQQIRDLTKR